jgi:hypothetical protein
LACITETIAVSRVIAEASDAGRRCRWHPPEQRRRPAAAGERLDRVQHGLVLDAARDDVAARRARRPIERFAAPRSAMLSTRCRRS